MKKEYYYDEEEERYMEMPAFSYPSDKELLEIFPEAKEIIPAKIKELKERKKDILKKSVKPLLEALRYCPNDFTRWYCREVIKISHAEDLVKINTNIERLRRLEQLTRKGGGAQDTDFAELVEAARRASIGDVVSAFMRINRSGKNYTARCPFHPDRNPSLFLYPETNSFYCFSCRRGGDLIKLIQLYFGKDFKWAVEYLAKGNAHE